MPILNASFELSPGSIWIATDWQFTSGSTVQKAGFTNFEDPFELFTWSSYSVDMTAWPPCLFNGWSELWETFDSGVFYDVWYSGWTITFSDVFVWSIFNDTFISGVVVPTDFFDWSVFDDTFTSGAVCLFNTSLGPSIWEDFESLW